VKQNPAVAVQNSVEVRLDSFLARSQPLPNQRAASIIPQKSVENLRSYKNALARVTTANSNG
jgi:hypothetical protein